MITAKCLFESACDANCASFAGCPFNRPDMYQTVNLLQIDCTVWQFYRESEKERRVRYATEKRVRDEIPGSRGKA